MQFYSWEEKSEEENKWKKKVTCYFKLLKTRRTFRSGCTPKFEPLKNKRKFKTLKPDELKFIPLKSNAKQESA